ncbi:MAG: DNA-3-methyladenine glycosylase 2 family protein [Candidatus Thalassarchaeaceae archaeon]|jgi:DNA-3-methyladenine glycosylase II|nr:DNA-3-methyladenine glycosylase 2 family protein [Candidatus Thalassarchaeaceae archaeon]
MGIPGFVESGLQQPEYWGEAKEFLSNVDGIMSRLIDDHEYPSLSSRGDVFLTLMRSVVGQQISSKAADSVWGRVEDLLGPVRPESILGVEHEDLLACGLSGRKSEYVSGIADSWLAGFGDIEWDELSDKEVTSRLVSLRGVGVWTAKMILIFSLLRPDVFPVADIAIIRSIERHYNQGNALAESELMAIGEPWRPYRTVATWYLWRSSSPNPVRF